jgi:glycosyltransferase involved in cell wall biosynthesis
MNIIFFNPYADSDVKGASRRIEFLSHALSAVGIHSTIISAKEYGDQDTTIFRKVLQKLKLNRLAFFFFALDLTNLSDTIVISEVIFAPTWRPNFFLTVHDLKVFNGDANRGGLLRKWSYWLFVKLANRIIAVSSFTRNELVDKCKVPSSKVFVVPNGISNSRLETAAKYIDSFKVYDFVYVSSFAKHKRHMLLLESLPLGSRLALIGRDLGTLDDIKQLLRKIGTGLSVDVFTNVDTDDQLFQLLATARCGVFPSVFEGFGIPLLEYAACGLSVVATDIPPFRDLAEYVDVFVRPDDKSGLQDALLDPLVQLSIPSQERIETLKNGLYSESMIINSLFIALGLNHKSACVSDI